MCGFVRERYGLMAAESVYQHHRVTFANLECRVTFANLECSEPALGPQEFCAHGLSLVTDVVVALGALLLGSSTQNSHRRLPPTFTPHPPPPH